jgi:hypothetical protein
MSREYTAATNGRGDLVRDPTLRDQAVLDGMVEPRAEPAGHHAVGGRVAPLTRPTAYDTAEVENPSFSAPARAAWPGRSSSVDRSGAPWDP